MKWFNALFKKASPIGGKPVVAPVAKSPNPHTPPSPKPPPIEALDKELSRVTREQILADIKKVMDEKDEAARGAKCKAIVALGQPSLQCLKEIASDKSLDFYVRRVALTLLPGFTEPSVGTFIRASFIQGKDKARLYQRYISGDDQEGCDLYGLYVAAEEILSTPDYFQRYIARDQKAKPVTAPVAKPAEHQTDDLLTLGKRHLSGTGVPQDYQKARECFQRAAEIGNAEAQYLLANMYDKGEGAPQNYFEALKWYRLAADQGNAIARFSVGVFYRDGLGVPQDYREAAKWIRLAADQGFDEAQFNYGVMHLYGHGVGRDTQSALLWLRKAANQGNESARNGLATLAAQGIR
jgi:hypothetical protein